MSDRLLVSTRKGLLTLERTRDGWAVASTAFAGIPVTNALRDARDGVLYRRAQARPFRAEAASLRRRRRNLARTRRRPRFRPMRPGTPSLFQIWTLEAGGRHHPGPAVDRRHSGRPVPLRRSRRELAARHVAVGRAGARALVRRRLRRRRHPQRLARSARCGPRVRRDFVRRRLGKPRRRRDAGRCSARAWSRPMCRPSRPATARSRIRIASRAAPRRPTSCGCSITPACTAPTDAGANWTQLKPPGDDFGFAVVAHPNDPQTAWFVPAIKDEIRMPRDGALCVTRTRDGGKTLGDAARRACRSATPTTSSTATASTSTTPASGSPWARPPARCGSATAAAKAGSSSTRICRRSTRCGSSDRAADAGRDFGRRWAGATREIRDPWPPSRTRSAAEWRQRIYEILEHGTIGDRIGS